MKTQRAQKKVTWTPADRARHKAIREFCQRERPGPDQLTASGRYEEPLPLDAYMAFRQAIVALKEERERQGLSLADVAERSGIGKASLSRLETGKLANPTVDTLLRYAAALDRRIEWHVAGTA